MEGVVPIMRQETHRQFVFRHTTRIIFPWSRRTVELTPDWLRLGGQGKAAPKLPLKAHGAPFQPRASWVEEIPEGGKDARDAPPK